MKEKYAEEISVKAVSALEKLKDGNARFICAERGLGDVSPKARSFASRNGQSPYAVIISCSDSRVIPESIFSAGIGDLFVIRAAGNVVDEIALGSIEYAISHLHTPLVVVLGHTGCGAVGATLQGGATGFVKAISQRISLAVGEEKDAGIACRLNTERSVSQIRRAFESDYPDVMFAGAIYDTESGKVDFFE